MSEVKFHPGLARVSAPGDCLCSIQRNLKCWWAANSFQTVLYQKFSTVGKHQVHCWEVSHFSLFCFFTQLNKDLQTLWVCTRSCFTTWIIKAPMKLKLLFLYCLFSWAHWFLSLFPLRFHQQQQQNWFYIDFTIPFSSHPPSHSCCILQLCPERILTRTTKFKALCFRHFGLNSSSSFFASWWRNYLWVFQWLF